MDNPEQLPDQAPVQITVTPEPKDTTVPIQSPAAPAPAVNQAVAQDRAAKAEKGLGFLGLDYDTTYSDIISGQERRVRENAAATLSKLHQDAAFDFVQGIIKDNGDTPLNGEQIGQILDAANKHKVDASSVLETYYGKTFIDILKSTRTNNPGNVVDQTEEDAPEVVKNFSDMSDTLLAKNLYARTQAQNLQALVDKQNPAGWAADQAKGMIPFYRDYKLRGNVKGTDFLAGGFSGGNLEAQRKKLMDPNVSFGDYKTQLDNILGALSKDNPSAAHDFAEAVVGQTTDDQTLNNVLNIVDIATIPGVKGVFKLGGKAFGRTVRSAEETAQAYKDVLKAVNSDPRTPSAIIEATGDIPEAAIAKMTERLEARVKNVADISRESLEDLHDAYKYVTDAIDLGGDKGTLSREAVTRLQERVLGLGENLIRAVVTKAAVERVPVLQVNKEVVAQILEDTKNDFPGVRNYVLNVDHLLRDPVAGTYEAVVKFGDPTMGQWTERQTAENWGNMHFPGNFEVVQKGIGFHILVHKPVSEVSDIIRDSLLKTGITTAPEGGWVQKLIGTPLRSIRSAEDTLSPAEMSNRRTAATTRSFIMQYAKGEADRIKDLITGKVYKDLDGEEIRTGGLFGKNKNQRAEDWNRVVTSTKDIPDPANEGKPGYFFKNVGELEAHYKLIVGRLPDLVETNAYFAFKNLMEMDRFLRNVAVYRNKARLGVQQHSLSLLDKAGNAIETPGFDAIQHREMVRTNGAILTVRNTLGSEKAEVMDNIPLKSKRWQEMVSNVKEGKGVFLQIFDPDSKPLKGFFKSIGDRRIQYIYVDKGVSHKMTNISYDQIPRRGGFHLEPEYDHYIKQANMQVDNFGGALKAWYVGDKTVMPVAVRKMGEDIVGKMNAVRELIKDGDLAAAKELSERTLPFVWKDFKARFESRTIDGVKNHPELNVKEPFHVVAKDEKIIDTYKQELMDRYKFRDKKTNLEHDIFVDGTRTGSLAKQYQVPFTGERDAENLNTFHNVGEPNAPVYEMANVKYVDPAVSINRALSKVANSLFMDDYKIFAMEHWLERARVAGVLKADPSEIRAAPFYHFSVGGNKESYLPSSDPVRTQARNELMQDWARIHQFTGIQDEWSSYLEGASQKFSDKIYGSQGEKAALISQKMLPFTKDAPAYLRSMAFHMSMGLFAVPQLLTQLSTYSNIFAIAGLRHAGSGTAGALMTAWTKFNRNPEILKALDSTMTSFGWKHGEFMESLDLMDRTGFGHIGSEYAMFDYNSMPTLVTGKWQGFLNAGKMFFNMGEKGSRYGAWHTAYREFRDAEPFTKIGNNELQKIRDRADLLNINMTSASASAINKGFWSIPTQFLTYQLRLTELFFSKRIDNATKLRMLGWNYAVYGLPATVGITGMPISDILRQEAIDHGYSPGDNAFTSLMMEGPLSLMVAYATGKGDLKKGDFLNIGDKLGQSGFTVPREVLAGDKGFLSLLGAAPDKLATTIGSTDDLWKFSISFLKQDPEIFKPTSESVLKIFKNVASANHLVQLVAAINTGKLMDKAGEPLVDGISPSLAVADFLTGLSPQKVNDIRNYHALDKAKKQLQETGLNNAIKEYRFGLANMQDNPTEAQAHFNNAIAELHVHGVPEQKFPEFMALANKNQTIYDSTVYNHFMRNIDPRQKNRLNDLSSALQGNQ